MKGKLTCLILIICFSFMFIDSAFSQVPTITSQPHAQGVIAGQSATFMVTAKSDTSIDTLHYQWFKNLSSIAGATNSSYTTSATVIGDNGAKFYCVVSDSNGSINTDTVKLFVTASGNRVNASEVAAFNFKDGSGATVHDVSGIGSPDNLTIDDTNNVAWTPQGLDVVSPAYIYSTVNETKILNACDSTNEVTVEAWVVPDNLSQDSSYIVSFQSNNNYRDLTMMQNGNELATKVRITPSTDLYGEPFIYTANSPLQQELMQIVYTRSANGIGKMYVNGTQVATDSLAGTFTDWSSTSRFGIAGGNPGGSNWLGIYYYVGVYNRALSSTEVSHNYNIGVAYDQKPVIIANPESYGYIAGESAHFEVSAIGAGTLSYQWQKRDVDIPSAVSSTYTSSALSISDDGATYRVIVSNTFGSDTSTEAHVGVTAANERVTNDLQVLYNFTGSAGDSVINDVSGVGTPVNLTIHTPSAVTWKPYGLYTNGGQLSINSKTPPKKLYNSKLPYQGVTIEAWIRPYKRIQSGDIVSLSKDNVDRNFLLNEPDDSTYSFRLRTTSTDDRGIPYVHTPNGSTNDSLIHIVALKGSDGPEEIWINGQKSATSAVGGDLSNWDTSYVLAIANEVAGTPGWKGVFNMLAIYDRSLDSNEIVHNYQMGPMNAANIPVKSPAKLNTAANVPHKIAISWADSSNNEDGFIIERKEIMPVASSYKILDSTAANITAFTDSTVQDTTTYTYRVRAYNLLAVSGYSNESTVKSLLSVLSNPTNLTATKKTPDSIHVQLNWKDNSPNESGFIVERKTGDSSSSGSFAVIDTLGANVTSFADTNTSSNTTYSYRVFAYNQFGVSAFSNIATITTPIITGIRDINVIPKEYGLYQNYPNPFNPSTTIGFALPTAARVTITIYNTLGQEVSRLLDRDMNAGVHSMSFNALNLASGIYFYRIVANGVNGKNFISTKRMLLLK
jgi:Concanavalin A-like lectin/glucanases superfamily/Secretion system C-terminal sorting domain/Fibronectin type III domain